jgi:surfactin family lipopeptide synthetase C
MDNIEQIYELTPMQQGMLFHSTFEQESGLYIVQIRLDLQGELNKSAFAEAWQQVVNRHPVLRTAFYSEALDKPLQVVFDDVQAHLAHADWSGLSATEQAAELASFLQADRARGFELEKPSQMRVTLIDLGEGNWHAVWSSHHLLMDGWAVHLVLKEFFLLYESLVKGEGLQLDSPRPYLDYLLWLHGQDAAEAEPFWKQYLEGWTAPTPLGIYRATSETFEKANFGAEQVLLTAEQTRRLNEWAREQHLTLNTLVQGAWALVLSRYSNEDDVLFGTVVSGRPADLPDVEKMVGLFINTLPARVRVQDEQTVAAWLQDLQAAQAELRLYEHCSLTDVQRWSDAEKGTNLFESLFVFENYQVEEGSHGEGSGLALTGMEFFERPHYPLNIVAVPGEQLQLKVMYDGQRFENGAIQRLLGHLQQVMEQFLLAPDQLLGDIDLLTSEEREQLLVGWNETARPYPNLSIAEAFEQQADATPDRVALLFGNRTMTYRELDESANRLARHLQAAGLAPGDFAGLCLERSFELIVCLLAILKAGAAYVPLDPSYPADRLSYMMEDARLNMLVGTANLLEKLPGSQALRVALDANQEAVAAQSPERLGITVSLDACAYVNYTSGSTGRPKGVLTPHRGVLRLVKGADYADFDSAHVFLQFAPVAFDAATFEIWGSLLNGARLAIYEHPHVSLEEVGRSVRDYGVTTMWLTAGLFHQMVEHRPEDLAGVSQLLAGGDALSVSHVKKILQHLQPGGRVINGYGPTESTTFAVCCTVTDAQDLTTSVPIGRPIANTQVYVLDRRLHPVPVGAIGELYIGGDGLALGYLNRPDLTEAAFVPHPFAKEPGARLYKTGDLVRWLTDGRLEFVGRADNQVKIRGFRIEPGEVEAALQDHAAVRSAVVLPRLDPTGAKCLVAYLVLEPGAESTTQQVRRDLQTSLPAYMIPSLFVTLDEMPLNANGKVHRQALPEPVWSLRDLEEETVAPRTEMEVLVARVWADALGLPEVGVTHNFFELGGHSLIVTLIVTRLREELAVEVPMSALFDCPTVETLAAMLSERAQAAEPEIERITRTEDILPDDLDLDGLSDEEVEALLAGLLAE